MRKIRKVNEQVAERARQVDEAVAGGMLISHALEKFKMYGTHYKSVKARLALEEAAANGMLAAQTIQEPIEVNFHSVTQSAPTPSTPKKEKTKQQAALFIGSVDSCLEMLRKL